MLQPDLWLEEVRAIYQSSDWERLAPLRLSINQSFADDLDSEGLLKFYEEAILLGLAPDKYQRVYVDDPERWSITIQSLFDTARQRIVGFSAVLKALYFEYFFDGGDDNCTADLFFCAGYSKSDDFWAAEFYSDEIIDGPSIFELMNFDSPLEWDGFSSYIAESYIDAFLLSQCLSAWKVSGIYELPFGFAGHDAPIIRASAISP